VSGPGKKPRPKHALSPHVRAEVQRILDAEGRRILKQADHGRACHL
jgi:hypothetical protein